MANGKRHSGGPEEESHTQRKGHLEIQERVLVRVLIREQSGAAANHNPCLLWLSNLVRESFPKIPTCVVLRCISSPPPVCEYGWVWGRVSF